MAAGVAIYETNPQLRAWLEDSRRKIALALQNLGPDRPNRSRQEEESGEEGERRRWYEEGLEAEMRRQGWNGEVFQQPGFEGVNMELRRRRTRASTIDRSASRSFDDMLSADGSLKREHHASTASSNGARGLSRGASVANPFGDEFEVTDENSQMLFDQELIGAGQDDVLEHEKDAIIGTSRESTETLGRSRESTATLRGDEKQEPLIDISEGPGQPQPNGPKTFFDNMLQSIMPGAFAPIAPKEDAEFEMQMRKAIEASLHDSHGDSSMLSADEDADLNAAIAASLEEVEAHEQRTSKDKQPETAQTQQPQPLAGLSQPNPWSDLSASATSFHSARGPSDSSFIIPVPEMSHSAITQPLTLPIPTTHTGQTEELYSLTPPGAQTPTSASFIASPSESHPSSPRSDAFSETFSTFTTPSHAASTPSEADLELISNPDVQPRVLAVSPLGERSEADAVARPDEEMSEVSGWSEVEGGMATPGDWTDVESEAEGMSEDGQHVLAQAQSRAQQGTQARL